MQQQIHHIDTIKFDKPVIFDELIVYNCPLCSTIVYYYHNGLLVFTSTHINTEVMEIPNTGGARLIRNVPRCQRCDAEWNHLFKAIDLMKRRPVRDPLPVEKISSEELAKAHEMMRDEFINIELELYKRGEIGCLANVKQDQ
jgi:hypothetical protein